MRVGELCIRDVVIIENEASVVDAAKLMRAYHVGDLVVVEEREGSRFPVGIITDRDLVVSVLAYDAEHVSTLSVGDVASREVVTAPEDRDVYEVLKTMRAHGIRRAPVVGQRGELVGIVSFDDLVELVAEEMSDLAQLLLREQKRERELRLSKPPEAEDEIARH